MAWYTTGTVNLVNNSATVIGVGTNFIPNVMEGYAFTHAGVVYKIQTVVSDTEVTLARVFTGATANGVSYAIFPTHSVNIDLYKDLTDLLETFGPYRFQAQALTDFRTEFNAAKADAEAARDVSITKAAEAVVSAQTADTHRATTEAAKNTAVIKAGEATTAAANALVSEQNADTSEANALAYKNAAETAKTQTEAARDIAVEKAQIVQDFDDSNYIYRNGTVSMTGELTLAGNPTADLHAVTKQWVESRGLGRAAVRFATTANLTVTATAQTLTAGSNGVMAAVDGVTPALNDLVLVKNQTAQAQNGIYRVTQLGSASLPFILTRIAEADTYAKLTGTSVFILEGTAGSGEVWSCYSNGNGTIGTHAINFRQSGGVGIVAADLGYTPVSRLGDTISGVTTVQTGSSNVFTVYGTGDSYAGGNMLVLKNDNTVNSNNFIRMIADANHATTPINFADFRFDGTNGLNIVTPKFSVSGPVYLNNMLYSTISNATTAGEYLQFKPSDYGTGKPYFTIKKEAAASTWSIGMWDGVNSSGNLNLMSSLVTAASQVNVNGSLFAMAGTDGQIALSDATGGMELGKQGRTVAGNPFIDFHSSTNNIDYDVRIQAQGGTANIGGGNLLNFLNSFLLVPASSATTDGQLINSPLFALRARYDSAADATVASANYDFNMWHSMSTGGASPASKLVFNIGGNDKAYLHSSGQLETITGSGTANSTRGVTTLNGSSYVAITPKLGAGSYNQLVAANDGMLLFSNGTQNEGGLVVGPWSNVTGGHGIRIDGTSIKIKSPTTTVEGAGVVTGAFSVQDVVYFGTSGKGRIIAGFYADTSTRSYFAGRNATDTDYAWGAEFGWDGTNQRWYFDQTPYIGANPAFHAGNVGTAGATLIGYTPLNKAGDTITGTLTFGSGSGIDTSTNDVAANMRIIRNAKAAAPNNDGLYLGYGNSNSGNTLIYGGGSTTNHFGVTLTSATMRGADISARLQTINSVQETVARYPGFSATHYSGNAAGTNDYGGYAVMELVRRRGKEGTGLAVALNDILGGVNMWGSYDATNVQAGVRIEALAAAAWTSTVRDSLFRIRVTQGTSENVRFRIDPNGDLWAGDGVNKIYHSGNVGTAGATLIGYTPANKAGDTFTGIVVGPQFIANTNMVLRGVAGEGGQLILGYKGTTAITGQSNSTWNLDVDSTDKIRLFQQRADGTTRTAFEVAETTGVIDFKAVPSVNGTPMAGGLSASAAEVITGNWSFTPTANVSVQGDFKIRYSSSDRLTINADGTFNRFNGDGGNVHLFTTTTNVALTNANGGVVRIHGHDNQLVLNATQGGTTGSAAIWFQQAAVNKWALHDYNGALRLWNAVTNTTTFTIDSADNNAKFYYPVYANSFGDPSVGVNNANLGGTGGRGIVAGYSGGNYGGLGYNMKHTGTSGQIITTNSDTVSYMVFQQGKFYLHGWVAQSAGVTLTVPSNTAGVILDPIAGAVYAGGYKLMGRNSSNYHAAENWLDFGGAYGLYWGQYSGATTGTHIMPTIVNSRTYGAFEVQGSRGGYMGIAFTAPGVSKIPTIMFDGQGNGGVYDQQAGYWHTYHHVAYNCLAVGGTQTYSDYRQVTNGNHYVMGLLYATSEVYAYSDIRLKENIVTIDSALSKVMKLRGVYYTRKDDEQKKRKVGYIAQEVEKELPEIVTTNEDGTKGVAYGPVVALLTEAVKELKAEVDALRAELAELRGK